MKLPHVTIEYREDENYAIGKMSAWLIIGLSLCLAWALVTLLSGHTLLFPNIADHREAFNNSAVFVYAASFLCYGVFQKGMRNLFAVPKRRNRIRFGATLLMAGSAVLMLVANTMTDIAYPIVLVAGFMAGLGSTILTMSFAVSFSVCDIATAGMSAGLSFALAVIVYALVVKYFTGLTVACAAFCILCPLVEFFCLRQYSHQLVDKLNFSNLTIPVKLQPFSLHVTLPCLLVGFAISIARVGMTSAFVSSGESTAALYAVLSAAAVSLVFIIGAILTQRQRFNFMARTLFPVSALAIAFLPFVDGNEPAQIFMYACAYILLDCALWVCLSDISQRFRVSAFVSFGFGYGAVLLGTFISLVLTGTGGPLSFLLTDHVALSAVTLVLLMFGFALLPNTTEIIDSLEIQGKCPALTTEYLELDMLQNPYRPQEETADNAAEEKAAERGPARAPGSESPAAAGTAPAPPAAEAATQVPDPARADASAPDGASESKKESDELDVLNERDEKNALEDLTQSEQPGRFKRKCAKVAETYLLSRKETEVLFLLAKGRNAAAIQEALYIAAGTANTHMRHIYRKLDVHSQQELIELVEATEVEDEDPREKSDPEQDRPRAA